MEKRVRWSVFAVAAGAVVVASLIPVGTAPEAAADAHASSDLLWHAVTYAAVTAVGLYAAGRDRWLTVAVGVFALGAGVEAAQAFVPYRTASAADAAANGVGIVAAVVVAYAVEWLNM